MNDQIITPETLMIGDYITDEWASPGCMWPVTSFNSRNVSYGAHRAKFKARYANIRPVELTPKLLVKFGFERTITKMKLADDYIDYRSDRFVLFYLPLQKKVEVEFVPIPKDNIDERTYISSVRYIHELQRIIIALTGVKLKVDYDRG